MQRVAWQLGIPGKSNNTTENLKQKRITSGTQMGGNGGLCDLQNVLKSGQTVLTSILIGSSPH